MATAVFDITPDELDKSAERIDQKKQEFVNTYNNIYQAVEDLRVTYKGESSEVFNKQIESYKKNFQAAEKALNSYVQFLKKYAANMTKVEQERKTKASQLKGGR